MNIGRPIPGYENHYSITEDGRVFSLKLLEPYELSYSLKEPYCTINLSLNGKARNFKVHELVMAAYGPKKPLPHTHWVIKHKDQNPGNHHIDNLEWALKGFAMKPESKAIPIEAIGIDDEDVIKFRALTAAAKYFHTNTGVIRVKIATGEVYKGYKFKFIEKK